MESKSGTVESIVFGYQDDQPKIETSVDDMTEALETMRQFLGERHHLDTLCHALYVRPTPSSDGLVNGHVQDADKQWVLFPTPAELSTVVQQAQAAKFDILTAILRYPILRYHFCRLAHLVEAALATRPSEPKHTLPTWATYPTSELARLAEKQHAELVERCKAMCQDLPPHYRTFRLLFQPDLVYPLRLDSGRMDWIIEQMRDSFHALAVDKEIQEPLRAMLRHLGQLPETILRHPPVSMATTPSVFTRNGNGGFNGTRQRNGSSDGFQTSSPVASASTSPRTPAPPSSSSSQHQQQPQQQSATQHTPDPLRRLFPLWDTLLQEVQNLIMSMRTDANFKYYAGNLFRIVEPSMTQPHFTQVDDFVLVGRDCFENVLRLLWLPRYQGPTLRLVRSLVALADQLWLDGGQTTVSLAIENGLGGLVHMLHHRAAAATTAQASAAVRRGGIRGAGVERVAPAPSASRSLFNVITLIGDAVTNAGLISEPIYLPSIDWRDGGENGVSELKLDNICLEFPETRVHNMKITSHLEHTASGRYWKLCLHGIEVQVKNVQYYYQTTNIVGRPTHDIGECNVEIPSKGLDVDLVMLLDNLPDLDPHLIATFRQERAKIWDRHPIATRIFDQFRSDSIQGGNTNSSSGSGGDGGTSSNTSGSQAAPTAIATNVHDSLWHRQSLPEIAEDDESSPNSGGGPLPLHTTTTSTATFHTRPMAVTRRRHVRDPNELQDQRVAKWLRNFLYPNWDKVPLHPTTVPSSSLQRHVVAPLFFHPFRAIHLRWAPTATTNGAIRPGRPRRGSSIRVAAPLQTVIPPSTAATTTMGENASTITSPPIQAGEHRPSSPTLLSMPPPTPLPRSLSPTLITSTDGGGTTAASKSPASTSVPTTPAPGGGGSGKSKGERGNGQGAGPTPISALLSPQPPGKTRSRSTSSSAGTSTSNSTKQPLVELVHLESCKVQVHRLKLDLVTSQHPLRNQLTHMLIERRLRMALQHHLHQTIVNLFHAVNVGMADIVRAAQDLHLKNERLKQASSSSREAAVATSSGSAAAVKD